MHPCQGSGGQFQDPADRVHFVESVRQKRKDRGDRCELKADNCAGKSNDLNDTNVGAAADVADRYEYWVG